MRITARRSAPTQTGQPLRRDRMIGSSPTSAASDVMVAGRGSVRAAPYPRETIAGAQPLLSRSGAIHRTSGVLPLPPTVMLPTTMTGIPGCSLFSRRAQYRNFLNVTPTENTKLAGHSNQARRPRRYQNFIAALL